MNKLKMFDILAKFLLLAMVVLPSAVYAVDLNADVSAEDKAQFDTILEPVMRIYGFVKYAASAIAAIALLVAGISYMTSGSDPKKRDNAKSIASYVLIGLVIIWATPVVVNLLI